MSWFLGYINIFTSAVCDTFDNLCIVHLHLRLLWLKIFLEKLWTLMHFFGGHAPFIKLRYVETNSTFMYKMTTDFRLHAI